MVCLGRSGKSSAEEDHARRIHLLSLGLSAGRLCAEGMELVLGKGLLVKAAELIDTLQTSAAKSCRSKMGKHVTALEAEYLALRITLVSLSLRIVSLTDMGKSAKENRLDLAEHMFQKIEGLQSHLDFGAIEGIAGTLREVGTNLLHRGDHEAAAKWLKRACGLTNIQDVSDLGDAGLATWLAVCGDLVDVLLQLDSEDSVDEASGLITYAESRLDVPVVLHWRLQMARKGFNGGYADNLQQATQSFDNSEGKLEVLLYHFKVFHQTDAKHAAFLLDGLLMGMDLAPEVAMAGKAIVLRV